MKKISLLFALALVHTTYGQPQVTVDSSNTKKTILEIDQDFALEYDNSTDLSKFIGIYQLAKDHPDNLLSYDATMIITTEGVEMNPKKSYYQPFKFSFHKTINKNTNNFNYEKGVFWLRSYEYKTPIVRINKSKEKDHFQLGANVYTFDITDFKPID